MNIHLIRFLIVVIISLINSGCVSLRNRNIVEIKAEPTTKLQAFKNLDSILELGAVFKDTVHNVLLGHGFKDITEDVDEAVRTVLGKGYESRPIITFATYIKPEGKSPRKDMGVTCNIHFYKDTQVFIIALEENHYAVRPFEFLNDLAGKIEEALKSELTDIQYEVMARKEATSILDP